MRTIVKGKNVEVPDRVREYAERRLGRLERLARRPDGRHRRALQRAAPQRLGRAHRGRHAGHRRPDAAQPRRGVSYQAAIDDVVDKVERQAVDHKAKPRVRARPEEEKQILRAHRRRHRGAGPRPRIVKIKRFAIEPMFEEDALAAMEELGHQFFVFVNAETERVAILYAREDGDFGLIEPIVGGEYTKGRPPTAATRRRGVRDGDPDARAPSGSPPVAVERRAASYDAAVLPDGRRLGAHLPLGGGMVKAVDRAHEIGATAIQIFTDNPTAWRRRRRHRPSCRPSATGSPPSTSARSRSTPRISSTSPAPTPTSSSGRSTCSRASCARAGVRGAASSTSTSARTASTSVAAGHGAARRRRRARILGGASTTRRTPRPARPRELGGRRVRRWASTSTSSPAIAEAIAARGVPDERVGVLPRHRARLGRRDRPRPTRGRRCLPRGLRRADRARAPGDGPPQRLEGRARLAARPPRAPRGRPDRGGRAAAHLRATRRWRARPTTSRRPGWTRATTRSTSPGRATSRPGGRSPTCRRRRSTLRGSRARTAPGRDRADGEPSRRRSRHAPASTGPSRSTSRSCSACSRSPPPAPAGPRDARHVGRRPGPRHARPAGARPRRRRAAAGSADVDRRRPPRRLVLLPPRPGRVPHRRRLAPGGRRSDRARRGGRGRGRRGGSRGRSAGPVAGFVAGLRHGGLGVGDRRIDLHLEPEPHRAVERGRARRRVAGVVEAARRAGGCSAAVGAALTMQCHVLGVTLLPVVGALLVADARRRRPGPERRAVVVAGAGGLASSRSPTSRSSSTS